MSNILPRLQLSKLTLLQFGVSVTYKRKSAVISTQRLQLSLQAIRPLKLGAGILVEPSRAFASPMKSASHIPPADHRTDPFCDAPTRDGTKARAGARAMAARSSSEATRRRRREPASRNRACRTVCRRGRRRFSTRPRPWPEDLLGWWPRIHLSRRIGIRMFLPVAPDTKLPRPAMPRLAFPERECRGKGIATRQ